MAILNLVITEKNDLLFQGIGDPSRNADFSLTDLDGEGGDPFAIACGVSWELVTFLEGVEYDPEDHDSWWSAREEIFSQLRSDDRGVKDLAERIFDATPAESVQAVLSDSTEVEVSYSESGEPTYKDVISDVQYETGQLAHLCEDLAAYVDEQDGYCFVNPDGFTCVPHSSLVEEFDAASNSYLYKTKQEEE